MTEDEEFEFRHRLEQEQTKTPANKPPAISPLQEAGQAIIQHGPMAPILGAARATLGGISNVSDIAGSGVTEGLSRAGLPPQIAAGAGTAANLATGTAIAGGAGKLATSAAPLLEAGARRLMQSSIKAAPETLKSGAADRAITTMLEQRIAGTAGGIADTQARVSSLENQVQSILQSSSAKIDPYKAADNIKTAIKDVSLNLDQARNLRDIEKVYDKFINHPAIKDMGEIPVATANKMKQAFYRELRDKAFTPGADLTASAKAEKALAGGLRQEIATAEPAVVPTLKEQAELLNVLKAAGPQAAREGNKNIFGMGGLSPSMENAAIWMLDRYPWFKSVLAQALYHGRERIPQAIVGTGLAAGEAEQMKRQ